MMSYKPRFELKYQLTIFEYLKVKNRMISHVCLDDYSARSDAGRYFIRSLYYDTFDYRAYAEKITGELNRIKIRMRSYFENKESAPFVSAELKTRKGSQITKFSTHIPIDHYIRFEQTGSWQTDDNPVLTEIKRLIILNALTPKLLVDYEREAYYPRDKNEVRITFDHSIRFASSNELYPKKAFFRSKDPHLVVMEIKTGSVYPRWLENIITHYGLKSVPNSKYAHGIEQTQHAMFL